MSIKTLVIAAAFVLSVSGVAVAETPSAGFSTSGAPTSYTAMKKHSRKHMRRSASPMGAAGTPTGGHSSGGGTSSGGMSR
jgi:hypothetical protein